MLNRVLKPLRLFRDYMELPVAAKSARRLDRDGLSDIDPGADIAIKAGIEWLGQAQDKSTSNDGGVARHYSLINGWSTSYPETTGYIISTMLTYAKSRRDEASKDRAERMLDWLVSIQFPEGGFQGGLIDSGPVVPVTFNTGQILLGLASGVEVFGEEYLQPMIKAADWLVNSQDADGCWRKNPTPFAAPGEKAYESHVAWGLLEAARISPDKVYGQAALLNIKWSLGLQRDNGWIDNCCLGDVSRPLTHTLGYALRGYIEGYRYSKEESILHSCMKTADGLLSAFDINSGFLPGRIDSSWKGAVSWACLTGTVQIAACWFMLYEYTGEARYRDAAFAANSYVRRTLTLSGSVDTRGGIKGSFPVNGGYGTYEYLNWACKFFVDSCMLEEQILSSEASI